MAVAGVVGVVVVDHVAAVAVAVAVFAAVVMLL